MTPVIRQNQVGFSSQLASADLSVFLKSKLSAIINIIGSRYGSHVA